MIINVMTEILIVMTETIIKNIRIIVKNTRESKEIRDLNKDIMTKIIMSRNFNPNRQNIIITTISQISQKRIIKRKNLMLIQKSLFLLTLEIKSEERVFL